MTRYLYDKTREHSSCGVGFITNKNSLQTQELLQISHQALCKIPHRGGMSAEGIGDGAGINIDLSLNFFRKITRDSTLQPGHFGVANFFFPLAERASNSEKLIRDTFIEYGLNIALWRNMPINNEVLNDASRKVQLPVVQIVFLRPKTINDQDAFEEQINEALLDIEAKAFTDDSFKGLYPLSMSSRTQVYKGRLNSWEVIPYFTDLSDPDHGISILFFHTRFSTNTAPNPMFAQPFRRMAHNGELNTDKKNRLSEDAIARQSNKTVIFPPGQSDSARLDQTLARRVSEDKLEIDTAILAMMPPAWENDDSYSQPVRDMLEYFSLCEEKNDGPAALIFSDGIKVGARLDRLGLRPLRSVETDEYLAVMSEAGQIDFAPESIIRRGRIEAGGMIVYNHRTKELLETKEILERLAQEKDYSTLLDKARITLADLPQRPLSEFRATSGLTLTACHVGYGMSQEVFKFLLDPMLQTGMEKISAMGYGLAPNALAGEEGGMSRYFSQRFAQVTNPPLDSIREADGMTLRVALGAKPDFSHGATKQLVLRSPILQPQQLLQLQTQTPEESTQHLRVETINTLYDIDFSNTEQNQQNLEEALERVCSHAEALARNNWDIIVLSDRDISHQHAALPAVLTIAAVNQRLIKQGLRFNSSIVYLTGQACSTHDIAVLLGFGASAVCPLTVYHRALELFDNDELLQTGLNNFQKAIEKSLMKTMGKFGLCTAESYIGGEFFEANFIDTNDPKLRQFFPNVHSPVGGAGFVDIIQSASDWHKKMLNVTDAAQIPLLGLFKERAEGSGHSFGNTAVREYINMTEENIQYASTDIDELLLSEEHSSENHIVPQDSGYLDLGYEARSPAQIDQHKITSAYRDFCKSLYAERSGRPAALRDVLALPTNLNGIETREEFVSSLNSFKLNSHSLYALQGIEYWNCSDDKENNSLNIDTCSKVEIRLKDTNELRHNALLEALQAIYPQQISNAVASKEAIKATVSGNAKIFFTQVRISNEAIALSDVQPAHEITRSLASGAMSHGALVAKAHEAVAMGTNIAGAMSNSGEGGESSRRYNSVSASKIKQFASGRFGVWTGYLADPCLQEIEIKIAQGAKPGEGGQLPSAKVNVEIAAARGATPGVELVSPPPHHDTYSIEDLGQLIHDAKAARVKVIVKLVSSEGIGTIAVGVAKAGADVINIAGNTGGTGAAQVTSLKNTGRVAEIGITEVHQSLAENGLRDKVILRCSNAHQTGLDVVKSAMMGGDSFEFGTTALMMLKCVMAKNCNVKCPAGLTTNPEVYQGDPRALAQYFINLAHETREILASLGYPSLRAIRGRGDLLHLIDHPRIVGLLDMSAMLRRVNETKVNNPIYLEADFGPDDLYLQTFTEQFALNKSQPIEISGPVLNNCNKTTTGQFSIDLERHLNYTLTKQEAQQHPMVLTLDNGRRVLGEHSIIIRTENSAGQSFAAFNNSGITLIHKGTCNDGVGKGASGGCIVVQNPGGAGENSAYTENNVLVGNFALFGATGSRLYVQGQAGDRFGVRNSGAVAVVEGVGDFCCEYMTYGSIVNLGSYGKGFGNGMSGGTAYQYDPKHELPQRCSLDSVVALPISEDNILYNDAYSELAQGQEMALLQHLQHHVNHTKSERAQHLLDDWKNTRKHFYYVIPRALFNHHCSDQIAKNLERKQMLEELSIAVGEQQLRAVKIAYETNTPLFDGKVPTYGERDTQLICHYVNSTGVLHRATEQAIKLDPNNVNEIAKKLIMTEARKVMDMLFKDAREAIATFSDAALASLLANKRVNDYKRALSLREVSDTHALGSSVWIIDRDKANRKELAEFDSIEQKLAEHYSHLLAEFMRAEAA
jgi:glutamate synthase (NADPH/NADH) large chain